MSSKFPEKLYVFEKLWSQMDLEQNPQGMPCPYENVVFPYMFAADNKFF